MEYEEALARLTGAKRLGTVPGLAGMRRLMAMLGDPQKNGRFVHVAGTNGKGSTAAYIAAMLSAAGYKTGLFTSPYIQDFRERIQINGKMISKAALAAGTARVLGAAAALEAAGCQPPTAFELVTALGLLYFGEENCDIVVLEVGLGGRLDATNVIPPPLLAVLTRIGLDHTELLGGRLEAVAGEKAGIVKPGSRVLACRQAPEVLVVFQKACKDAGCPLHLAGAGDLVLREMGPEGLRLDWGPWKDLRTGMTGLHQMENAALALKAAALLGEQGWDLDEQSVRRGLSAARCPARLELLCRAPLFFADGAHNLQGVSALAESLAALLPGKKFCFLTGMLADKDHRDSMARMLPLARAFYTVTPPSPRALSAGDLAAELRRMTELPVRSFPSTAAALSAMLADCGPAGACCAFGSLYLMGEVRGNWKRP